MKIVGIDIETTGVKIGEDRIIEVYAGLWNEHGVLEDEIFRRINPERSIRAEAERVHGISIGEVEGEPIWDLVAPDVSDFLIEADVFVAHNGIEFDGPFLTYELERVHRPGLHAEIIDTMQARWATPQGKNPTLAELCFAMSVPYDASKGHAASYDVAVMMECFFKGVSWGWFRLPSPTVMEMRHAA